MQFVNLTNHVINSYFAGSLGPGRVSADGGAKRRRLEEAIEEVIKACGKTLGIRLNKRECELLDQLMKLDEAGSKFNPETIPSQVRNDPTGAKRAEEAQRAAQQKAIDDMKSANASKAKREAMINGEVENKPRKPVGPATMEGEKVEPGMLKSGFEKIMEANARIARGENINPSEMLDPIGAHAKKENAPAPTPVEPKDTRADAAPIKTAENRQDDAVRTADAKVPDLKVNDRAGSLDKSAADVARKLSVIGPAPEAPEAPKQEKAKGRGRTRKTKETNK